MEKGHSWASINPENPGFFDVKDSVILPKMDNFYATNHPPRFDSSTKKLLLDLGMTADHPRIQMLLTKWAPTAPLVDARLLGEIIYRESCTRLVPIDMTKIFITTRQILSIFRFQTFISSVDLHGKIRDSFHLPIAQRSVRRALRNLWQKKMLIRFREGKRFVYTLGYALKDQLRRENPKEIHRKHSHARMETYGVLCLHGGNNGGMSSKEIAERRAVSTSSVSRLIRDLIALGWVKRIRKGRSILYLTIQDQSSHISNS